jgi:hypothetical protein
MTIKHGRHQLTGMVSLGEFFDDMNRIKTGIMNTMQNKLE